MVTIESTPARNFSDVETGAAMFRSGYSAVDAYMALYRAGSDASIISDTLHGWHLEDAAEEARAAAYRKPQGAPQSDGSEEVASMPLHTLKLAQSRSGVWHRGTKGAQDCNNAGMRKATAIVSTKVIDCNSADCMTSARAAVGESAKFCKRCFK